MQELDKNDIQGLVSRGFGKLRAKFLMLRVTDAVFAKNYLTGLSNQINTIEQSRPSSAVIVAFSADGLKALGLPKKILDTFSREFLEGMDDPYRSFLLGDEKESHPENWHWGGPTAPRVHILLMLYDQNDGTLELLYNSQVDNADFKAGIAILYVKETTVLEDGKEHFGFRDGITQPDMQGLDKADNLESFRKEKKVREGEDEKIRAGEFVLGYKNEYGSFAQSPEVLSADDPKNILPVLGEGNTGKKDLGKNGTYLVYREIEQDVPKFWQYLMDNAAVTGDNITAAAILLGAKMVGRWPNGTPIVLKQEEVNDIDLKTKFNYFDEDIHGEKCPIGSHIRRTNPRDQLLDKKKDTSIEVIRKHQLIRRGRAFGAPLVASMQPGDIMKAAADGQKRGLHFICLNASISRQFEFIQSIWIKSSKFGGLYNDADPLLGGRSDVNNEFTCPMKPVREKYKNIPSFTTVVGGAYFFLPGVRGVRFIGEG